MSLCMRVTLVLSKPSHYSDIATLDVNRMCVDEEDDFRLVGAQSCVRQSSSTRTKMSHSPRRCPAMFDPVVGGRVNKIMT
jgi:hypothetical protein